VIVAHGIACVHVPVSLPPAITHATLASVPHEPSVKHAPGAPHSLWLAHLRQVSVEALHTGVELLHAPMFPDSQATHWRLDRSHTGAAGSVQSPGRLHPCGPSPPPSARLQL
jgi:hypothetical protein